MLTFFKLWARLTNQKVVYLKDHDGTVTITVAKKTPFGYVAKRRWSVNFCNVILLRDGRVGNVCYVEEWKPAE